MKIQHTLSQDGYFLKYAYSNNDENKPWLMFIIPFGLELEVTEAFFNYFSSDYNVVSYEARIILADNDAKVSTDTLTVENHVKDLFSVMSALDINKTNIVGYCSGAGIALAAINDNPEAFDVLLLVSGEYVLLHETDCITQFGHDINSLLPMAAESNEMAQFLIDRMSYDNESLIPKGVYLPFSELHYLRRYSANYVTYRQENYSALASAVKNNTGIIAGTLDLQSNVNSSIKIHQLIENSCLYVDEKGDHYGVLRENSHTLEKIKEFLVKGEISSDPM